MLLDDILQRNQSFVKGPKRQERERLEPQMAIVTCIDSRLTGFLEEALGLRPGEAVILRTAGATIASECRDVLRSLAVAVYLKNVREILVIGHTDCALGELNTSALIDAIRQRQVPRDAFGAMDLRTWVGAFHDPKRNVAETVSLIVNSPYLPKDIPVHGLLIDIQSGKLEVIVNGYAKAALAEISTGQITYAEPEAEAKKREVEPTVTEKQHEAEHIQEDMTPAEAIAEVRSFFREFKLRKEFSRIRSELKQQIAKGDPLKTILQLEDLANGMQANYPRLLPAVRSLRRDLEKFRRGSLDYISLFREIF